MGDVVQLSSAVTFEESPATDSTPGTKRTVAKRPIADAEVGSTPPKKARAPAPAAGEVILDGKILEKAEKLSMRSALTNLASRVELQGKGLSAGSLLTALVKTNGLVNSAKRVLLGL